MAAPLSLIYPVIYLLSACGANVVLGKHEEPRGEEAGEGPRNPVVIEYLEESCYIRPHLFPFMLEPLGSAAGEPDELLESQNQPRDDEDPESELEREDTGLNRRMLEPSYSLSFVNVHSPYSCALEEPRRGDSYRLARLGSGREQGPGDLDQLIESNRSSRGVLLVDFFATWWVARIISSRCGPCRKMNENLEVLKSHYRSDKLLVHSIDVDKDSRYNRQYDVTVLPTLIFFVAGKVQKRMLGLSDVQTLIKEIDSMLDLVN